MAEQFTYLIIGNGIAGVTAAETLREENAAATIGMIAEDSLPVYYRPALKDYLGGRISEDRLWARAADFYRAQKIACLPGRVVEIQPDTHKVQLQSGQMVRYQKLLLANGARPARLLCPGAQLRGVFTLRTITDYQAVLERLPQVRHAVVSGSGTLALETVETLRQRNVRVTHLLRRSMLWSEVLDETASDLVLQQERHAGVDVCLAEEITEIRGTDGEVSGVVTNRGRKIDCDIVLVAIGIQPNIEVIGSGHIAHGRGLRTDGQMRTSAIDIYAAGDLVETRDRQTGRTRAIGQWYPAIQQARTAAYSMLGLLDHTQPFEASTFYNATFLYGLDFASAGLTHTQPGYQEIIAEPQARNYRKVLLKDGVPVGMLTIGERSQALALKRAIDHRVNLQTVATRLFTTDFHLDDWLDRQGIPPPFLSARKGDNAASHKDMQEQTQEHRKQSMEGPMLTSQPRREEKEALLVHIAESGIHLPETVLGKSSIVTIGRQAGVHLLIDERSVSRRHAEILYTNDQYVLRDVGSSNGTFVNTRRLETGRGYILQANDQIRFGSIVKFRFLIRALNPAVQDPLPIQTARQAIPEQPYSNNTPPRLTTNRTPALNPDGSLLPPGATLPVPPDIVATFKEVPTLIILPEGASGESNNAPQVYLLKTGKHVRIGREKGNDIEIADAVMSRRHAEVLASSSGFYIHDLGSSHGVLVNQVRIEGPHRLTHGDCIVLGSTLIFFVDLQAGREPTEQLEKLPAKPRRTERAATPANAARPERPDATGRVAAAAAIHMQSPGKMPQVVICPHCGIANMRVARFCAGCSALLSNA